MWDKFHKRWIYIVIVLLIGGCVGCAMRGDKPTLIDVVDAVKEACDPNGVSKIEFDNKSAEEPRVKSGVCQSPQVIQVR